MLSIGIFKPCFWVTGTASFGFGERLSKKVLVFTTKNHQPSRNDTTMSLLLIRDVVRHSTQCFSTFLSQGTFYSLKKITRHTTDQICVE